jgi:hypothetical protein
MANCPECEYCCAVGLCCSAAQQLQKLTLMFVDATGGTMEECVKYAKVLVDARLKAQKPEGRG